ncbi:hypothetical protein Slu03_19630 [Sediminihabitans luteus]|nr:hypothetical protein Slu03_19630 [Sediminihabitans luteus]
MVHARRDVPALRAARAELAALGLPAGLDLDGPPGPVRLPRAGTWVVGDAFSGSFQSRLAAGGGPARLVLVDDGLATLALADVLLAADRPVQRVGSSHHRLRRALGLRTARRLRALAADGRLTLFTAMPLGEDAARLADSGITVVRDDLGWLRSRPAAAPVPEATVVLGSGLVADGLVDPDAYVAWVGRVVAEGPVRYLPHRRHDRAVTRRVAALGATVEAPGAPAEIRLRSLGEGQRVLMLPSTALVLLGSTLAGSGADVVGVPVPAGWWTRDASPALRAHLSSVLDLAARPGTGRAGGAR